MKGRGFDSLLWLHGSGDSIVHFGDDLPSGTWRRAEAAILDCDLLIVAGTSLSVYPAASLVGLAQDDDKNVAIVNQQKTAYDEESKWVIRGDCSEVLPAILP